MSKGLIAFIVVAAIAIMIIIMKGSANIAQKRSDDILEHFKTIDRNLHKTIDSLDSINKIDPDPLMKVNK